MKTPLTLKYEGIATVYEGTPYRDTTRPCLCHDIVRKGEDAYKVCTPNQKRGMWVHTDCMHKFWDDYSDFEKSEGQNFISQTIAHTLEVRANKWESIYFGSMGFKVTKLSPTHRTYILDCSNNAEQSGMIVPVVLKHGCRTFINGTEVHSVDEYHRLLGK